MPFFTSTTLSLHHLPLLLLLFFSSSCSTPHTRRILHQPIFTTDSPPPTSTTSPPTPDYPFSTPTPPGAPFFPDSPPLPPPPPSPSSLASFPANISSLNLPPSTKSKPTSTKLIAISISSILTAIIILLIALSLHFKKRKNHPSSQPKNTPSDTSSFNNTHATLPKLTRPSQTSSEFLYLGTLVNSHVVLNSNPNAVLNSNSHVVLNSNPTQQNALNTRKMDSPELHPLPPLLNRQTPVNSGHQMGFSGRQLEGSDEFYSPRESVGVGSMSRRGFESVEVGKVNMSRSSSSSSSLYSGSPARSGSLSVSPSISASPNRAVSRPKSPELEAVQLGAPVGEIEGMRVLDGSDDKDVSVLVFNPFRFSSVVDDGNVGCSEGNKDRVVRNEDDSNLEVSGLADQDDDLQPRMMSDPLEDSEERIPESGSLSSAVSDRNVDSSDIVTGLAGNDNVCLEKSRRSDVSDQSVESLKSVIRVAGLEVKDDEYYHEAQDSDVLDQSVTMVSGLAVKDDEYFPETRSSDSLDQSVESPKSVTSPVKGSGDTFESYSQSLDQDVQFPERVASPVAEMVGDTFESYPQSLDPHVQSPERVASPVAEMVEVSELSSTSSNVTDHSVESLERFASPVTEMVDVTELSSSSSNVTYNSVESPERFASLVTEMVDVSESHSTSSNVPDHRVDSPERFASPVTEMVDVSASYSAGSNVPDHSVESPERFPIPVSEMVDVSESYSTGSIVPDHSVECPVKQETPAVFDASEQLPPPIFVPPPPPPPPPRKYWESPRTPSSLLRKSISGPPALVAPLRPILIESPILISPMQLPTQSNNRESNEASAGTSANLDEGDGRSEETPKPKLKPLHWDKVRASSDREMVWDQLRSSSFKLNEEMIESLFIVKAPNSTHVETTRRQILPLPNQDNRVLDAKKSQNIAILLKALHVTVDEVCESLLEGNAETLGTDLLESLLKMAPSKEEEHNLKEHKDDSPVKLGSAERFLKEVLDIPFAFKRIDAMLYISNFDSEVEYLKKSFETLETASEELRNSRMFLKLLEAVLKTGNRMNVGTNRGDAHAFKLDTLLKLVDIKGADGKTTLLHFVVQEITRTEGARISESNPNQTSTTNDDVKCRKLGLQVVSSLASDLTNVKKAAAMDSEVLNSDVMKLSKGLEKIMEVIRLNETIGSDQISSNKFSESMNKFMKFAEEEIIRIQAQESVALTLVKEITEYFHGNSAKEEAHPFRIFMVVRDFLSVLERVCKEVGMINERTIVSSAHKFPVPVNPMLQPVSSGFPGRRQGSSSDDETPTS